MNKIPERKSQEVGIIDFCRKNAYNKLELLWISVVSIMATKKTEQYGNSSISMLKGEDRVRKRPAVIFGSDDLEGCTVVFKYNGFMPSAYNVHSCGTTDSGAGYQFSSRIHKLDENEAELGFDYVFVNGTRTNITVQIAIYDKAGTQLSITESIEIPLMRNHHTILRGSFLMQDAQGGVNIDPGYDGDHNLIL